MIRCFRCGEEWEPEDLAGFEVYGMFHGDDDTEHALVRCPCGAVLTVYDEDVSEG